MFLGQSEETLSNGSQSEERNGAAAASKSKQVLFNLVPKYFYCVRSREFGHDEVYFTLGSGNYEDGKFSYRTKEFGSVSSGTSREFSHPPYIHSGMVTMCPAVRNPDDKVAELNYGYSKGYLK
ncbi:hypothetical protein BJX65DRAFT_315081 [Aspergillus insuetus]